MDCVTKNKDCIPQSLFCSAFRSKKETAKRLSLKCWRYLFFRPVSRQVSSAQMSLTSVFGMGTGGPSSQSTPTYFLVNKKVSKENFNGCFLAAFFFTERLCFHTLKTEQNNLRTLRKRLHSYSLEPAFRSSPRLISTGQLHTLLHFHLRPINDIVYVVPYSIKDERSHLRESFTLRCFQRLSRPHLATLLCRWHDNRCTRGASIPVLSY